MVSLVERGHLDRVSLRLIRRLLAALDASAVLEVRWRGASIDRLLDEDHARLVASVADYLRRAGWLVEVEVTYSEFGERGSFDLLAFHPVAGIVLGIEVKTELGSAEATLRKLDEKSRLAAKVALVRFGWQAGSVSRLLVIAETATARRQLERHKALFDGALPARNVATKRWLRRPSSRLAGVWFFADSDRRVAISVPSARDRVRVPKSHSGNHGVAS